MKRVMIGILSFSAGAAVAPLIGIIEHAAAGHPAGIHDLVGNCFVGGIAGLAIGLWGHNLKKTQRTLLEANHEMQEEMEKRVKLEKALRFERRQLLSILTA